MAGSLGTLTLDLVAKIGAFTGPLDKASQEAKKRNAEISKSFDNLAKGIGVAIGSIPAILAAFTLSAASNAKELGNLASVAGLGTTEFQKLSAGALTVGISNEKLSDIFKDVNDKLGDFLNTGAGPLADFFTNIGPKVGVTADQFRKLNSADALQLYVTSLQKAGASQKEMTFYMEAIASDATGLIPLLRDGGKGFRDFGDAALAAGVILDETTIEAGKQFNIELGKIGQYVKAVQVSIASELLPVVAQFSKDVNKAAKDSGGLSKQVGDLGDKVVEASAFIASSGDGLVRVFKIVANTLVGTYATGIGYLNDLSAKGSAILAKLPGDTGKEYAAQSAKYASEAKTNFDVAAQAAASIKSDLETPLAGDQFKQYVKSAKDAAAAAAKILKDTPEGPGTGVDPEKIKAAAAAAKKAAAEAAAAAKKIQETFKSTQTDYERQITLINTSTDRRKDATEVAKLGFEIESGKLVGINAQQQERLNKLAAELDALNKLKVANEDAAKLAAFTANLDRANQDTKDAFDLDLAGAGKGEKYKDRLKQLLAIRQDFNSQMRNLQEQQNSGEIMDALYQKELKALEKSRDDKIAIQTDYYSKIDEAQSSWLDGVNEAWENYAETAQNYSQIAQDAVSQQLGNLQSGLSTAFSDILTKNQSVGDAFTNLVDGMVSSLIKGLADMAAQWVIYQALQMVLGETSNTAAVAAAAVTGTSIATAYAPAAAAASLASFGGNSIPAIAGMAAANAASTTFALAGMAHDGIDSVPETGTWLLQKGERVTTAETSAKLDRTLAEIGSSYGGVQSPSVVINFHQPNVQNARDVKEANASTARKVARAVQRSGRYI